MNILRKAFISAVLALATFSAFACLVPGEEINSCIAGVGYYFTHIDKATFDSNPSNCVAIDNIPMSMPMTLWFNIHTRSHEGSPANIVETKLFYKIIPSGSADDNTTSKWRRAKTIDTSQMNLSNVSDTLIKLFGNLSFTMATVKANRDTLNKGDAVIFIWYVLYDDALQSCVAPVEGANLPRFTVGDTKSVATDYIDASTNRIYNPAFVLKVIYNGLTTP